MSKGIKKPREEVMIVANNIVAKLLPLELPKIVIAGSLRRESNFVGDIDIAVGYTMDQFADLNRLLMKIFGRLKTDPSQGSKSGIYENIPVQIVSGPIEQFGATLLHATGSSQFNIIMRKNAKRKGWMLNQYGLWHRNVLEAASTKLVCNCATEQNIFNALEINYKEPKERSV